MKKIAAFFLAMLFLASPVLAAKENQGDFSLTVFGGAFSGDGSASLGSGNIFGLKLGYDLKGNIQAESIGFEGVVGRISASVRDDKDGSGTMGRLDLIYPLLLQKQWTPFLSVGGGYATLDQDDETIHAPLVAYGGGVKYAWNESLLLRAELRQLRWFSAEKIDNLELTAGISYLFGQEKKVVKKAPLPDADRDGVPDKQDRCPDTPKGMEVDKFGCPIDKTDTDKDKVPDYLDKCPGTGSGVKVDKDGCPVDSDGDGVPDHLDKCPDTPAGLQIDETGCVPVERKGDRTTFEVVPPTPAPAPAPATDAGSTAETPSAAVPVPVIKEQSVIEPVADAAKAPAAKAAEAAAKAPPTAAATIAPVAEASKAPAAKAAEPAIKAPTAAAATVAPVAETVDAPATAAPAVEPTKGAAKAPAPTAVAAKKAVPSAPDKPGKRERMAVMILFDFDQAKIRPQHHDRLTEIAAELKKDPAVTAIIEGHTDSRGSDGFNYRLGQKRADAVRNFLIEQGIAPARLEAKSYGETRPVADNVTDEGRQQNRRAVTIILEINN